MFSGIVSLAVAKEVATAQADIQAIAEKNKPATKISYEITYDVSKRGNVKGDLEEFRKLVAETYGDSRGWIRAGVKFKEVSSGGKLHVVLASGAEIKAFSPTVCSEELSCRVGSYALINDDRWLNATESYNSVGQSLKSYRQMVINHETGHYLDHPHEEKCEAGTGIAPVMLQQSTGLRGCKANVWPLAGELWVKF